MGTSIAELMHGEAVTGSGRVHYVEKGTGRPLILIHGYAPVSSWRVWEANIDELSSERRVIAVDLPGYGDSPEPSGGRPSEFGLWFSTYAEVIHELIKRLDLAPAALGGLSAGGAACLTAAVRWPEDLERLVLVDSAGAMQPDRWKELVTPTLIVWQREDRLLPLDQGEKLQRAISGSRLEIVEGNEAGIEPFEWHWAQALNPKRFNRLALEFLRG